MKSIIQKIVSNKVIRFVLVGGCSTLIDFIIYIFLSVKINITVAKAISMVCSSAFSYIANKNFTFSNREKTSIFYLIRFYVVFGANLITNIGMNRWIYMVSSNKVIAFGVATFCGMTVNYLGQRFIVFRGKKHCCAK